MEQERGEERNGRERPEAERQASGRGDRLQGDRLQKDQAQRGRAQTGWARRPQRPCERADVSPLSMAGSRQQGLRPSGRSWKWEWSWELPSQWLKARSCARPPNWTSRRRHQGGLIGKQRRKGAGRAAGRRRSEASKDAGRTPYPRQGIERVIQGRATIDETCNNPVPPRAPFVTELSHTAGLPLELTQPPSVTTVQRDRQRNGMPEGLMDEATGCWTDRLPKRALDGCGATAGETAAAIALSTGVL